MLKIKDKVINNGLKGQIIDIKEADKRKLWTFGFDLESDE